MPKNRFQIIGINENNLKNVDFDGSLGEIITVCGVSGSGKSTLVNSVIATEAQRQNRLRRQSDVLYDYCVRPNFISTTELPNATTVSQRGFYLSKHSTFGTRTKLNELITRLFVSNGEIIHNGKKLQRPTRAEAVLFRNNYSPTSSLFFCSF